MYKNFLKRILDIILSFGGLIVLAVPLLIVAYKIKKNLGSPVIFKQKRPGLNGKIFELYKFRSMSDARDEFGNLLPDKDRLTPFGRKLRATSVDELPELINIFKGDMSIVGPRPLLVEYLSLYSEEQAHRHDVRPGLTGWAQVNGRNAISWDEKFNLDVWYTRNVSLLLDAKIIAMTIKKVLIKEGINSSENVTMKKFKGNKK